MTYFSRLATAACKDPDTLLRFTIDNYQDFLKNAGTPSKKKGSIRFRKNDNYDKACLSAVMNDLTFVDFEKGKSFSLAVPKSPSDLLGDMQATICIKNEDEERILKAMEKGQLNIAFISQEDEFCLDKLRYLRPFIENGKMIPAPKRALMFITGTATDGTRTWSLVDADPFQTLDVWDVSRVSAPNSTIPFVEKKESTTDNRLVEIAVPFLSGIDPINLCAILDDEQDVLDEFRAHIRALAKKSLEEGAQTSEFIDDVIKPEIAKVDRKFRKISNMSSVKLGSAMVGTAAITLASAYFSGLSAAVTTMAGGSGLALIAKEMIGAKEARHALKDENMYLLWRINGLTK